MVSFVLVDLTLCLFWTRFPMMMAVEDGQYLVALAIVRPGQEEELPALMDFNYVERTR